EFVEALFRLNPSRKDQLHRPASAAADVSHRGRGMRHKERRKADCLHQSLDEATWANHQVDVSPMILNAIVPDMLGQFQHRMSDAAMIPSARREVSPRLDPIRINRLREP